MGTSIPLEVLLRAPQAKHLGVYRHVHSNLIGERYDYARGVRDPARADK